MATWYYVVGSSSYTYLTQAQKEENALNMAVILRSLGWTDIAIAGVFGNIDHEGIFNSGQCEVDYGVPTGNNDTSYAYGLGFIQWTKVSGVPINSLLRYAGENNTNWYDPELQTRYIDKADDPTYTYGGWGWIQNPDYPRYQITFSDFKTLNSTPSFAAKCWLYDVERPGNPQASENDRAQSAEQWYTFLQQHSYVPRLDIGDIYTSPYYTTWNAYWTPNDASEINMPNCTAYAFGRWNELTDTRHRHSDFPTGAGYQWYDQGIAKGFTGGMVPQLGAAACWDYMGYEDGVYTHTGHVAIVEQINYDSQGNPISFVTSNSAWYRGEDWDEPQNRHPWFYLNTISMSNLDDPWGKDNSHFKGFLYNTRIAPVPPTPPPSGNGRKMPFIFYLKRHI